MGGRLVIVTGAPGAGKSTLARRLAGEWPEPATLHLTSDDLWTCFVKGLIPPWRPESADQNGVVAEAMAVQAAALAVAYPVFFDGIVGPWFLEPFRREARSRGVRLDYLVLRPSREVAIARGVSRGDHPMREAQVIGRMWDQLADLGPLESHALDTSFQAIEQTLAAALDLLSSDRLRLV